MWAMRANSERQWTAVATFLETHHTNMKGEYKMDQEEAWIIIQKILDKLFELGAEVRSAAQDLPSHLDPRTKFSVLLWTSLQFATLMDELETTGYIGHHALVSVQNEHLMMYRVAPVEFKKLKDAHASSLATIQALVTNVEHLMQKGSVKAKVPLTPAKAKK